MKQENKERSSKPHGWDDVWDKFVKSKKDRSMAVFPAFKKFLKENYPKGLMFDKK